MILSDDDFSLQRVEHGLIWRQFSRSPNLVCNMNYREAPLRVTSAICAAQGCVKGRRPRLRRFDSMMKALDEDRDFYDMFILLFGETLTGFLAILVRFRK